MIKNHLLLIPALLVISALAAVKPDLLNVRRFESDFPPWKPIEKAIPPLPAISVASFGERVERTWEKAGSNEAHTTGQTLVDRVSDDSGSYGGDASGWFSAYHADGSLAWKFHVDRAAKGIHSAPILHRGRVYFAATNGTMYCLDKTDGTVVWTATAARGSFGPHPILSGDNLIVSVSVGKPSRLYEAALELRDGHLVSIGPL